MHSGNTHSLLVGEEIEFGSYEKYRRQNQHSKILRINVNRSIYHRSMTASSFIWCAVHQLKMVVSRCANRPAISNNCEPNFVELPKIGESSIVMDL